MNNRQAYIKANYTLEQMADGSWRASAKNCGWSDKSVIEGLDKVEVIRQFRAHWGHFNYSDEFRAFAEIFGS